MMVQGLEEHLPYGMGGEVRHMPGSFSPTSSTTSTSSPSLSSSIPQDSDSDQSTESTKATSKNSSPQPQQHLGGPELRRYRTAFTREQITRLDREFQRESYINRPRRCELADELELGEATIKIWFQNRRMKDKRQKTSITWPYTNPTLAAYLLHSAAAAAGTYSPYLPHPAAPWPATIGLGATNPLVYGPQGAAPSLHYGPQGLPYPTPVQSVPSVARFAPYPRLHPAASLSPSYPDAHPQFSRTHLPSCPALTSPMESCMCAVFNPSLTHHGLLHHSTTTHSHVIPGTSSPLTPSHSSGSSSCSGSESPSREASPVAQSQSPHSLSIFPVPHSSSSSPSISSPSISSSSTSTSSSPRSPACRLFRPYDDEPSPKM